MATASQPKATGAAPGGATAGPTMFTDTSSYGNSYGAAAEPDAGDSIRDGEQPLLIVSASFTRYAERTPGVPRTANTFRVDFADSEIAKTGFEKFPDKKQGLLRAAKTLLNGGQQLVKVVQENATVLRTLVHEQIREIPEGTRYCDRETGALWRVGKVVDCTSDGHFGIVAYWVRIKHKEAPNSIESKESELYLLARIEDDSFEHRWPISSATIQEAPDEDVVDAWRLAMRHYDYYTALHYQLGDESGLVESIETSEERIAEAYAELERRGKLGLIGMGEKQADDHE